MDWDNHGTSTLLASIQLVLLTYFLMVWRSRGQITLFVIIVISDYSWWIKLIMISDLMFFKALFKLVIWLLLFFIKLVLLSLFIGTMTCFLDGPFIVMIILGLDLPSSLMIFCIFFIFFAWRFGRTFLILRTSLVLLSEYNAWAYNLLLFLFLFIELVILKNLEISLISLGNLAGISKGNLLMLTDLSVFFSSFFPFFIGLTFRVYLKDIFYLKELLFLLAKSKFHLEL